jgi:imidazolonepropionase-like amidohydrolase
MIFSGTLRAFLILSAMQTAASAIAKELPSPDSSSAPAVTIISGATLIDGTSAPPVDDSIIYIRDGRIERVASGDSPVLPEDATIIDAEGKFIVPGIVDAHTHIDSVGGIALTEEQKVTVREYYPRAFLFHGVTTVLNMSAHDTDLVLAMRERVREHPDVLLPRIYTGASSFTAADGWGSRHGGGLESAAEIQSRLNEYAERRVDLVKIINEDGLGSEDVFPRIPEKFIAEIVRTSKKKGLPVFVHATDEDEYLQSITARPRAMAHGLLTPQAAHSQVVKGLKENGIFVVPTIVLFEAFYAVRDNPSLLDDPLLEKSVPGFVLDAMHDQATVNASFGKMDEILRMGSAAWARSAVPDLKANIKLFADSGIKIAVGTDGGGAVVHSFQGYNTPREMEILADCCLSNMDTIVAATRTVAEIMDATDVFGTLKPGRSADLLILNSDPLTDMKAIRDFDQLMLRGHLIDRAALTYQAHFNEKSAER